MLYRLILTPVAMTGKSRPELDLYSSVIVKNL